MKKVVVFASVFLCLNTLVPSIIEVQAVNDEIPVQLNETDLIKKYDELIKELLSIGKQASLSDVWINEAQNLKVKLMTERSKMKELLKNDKTVDSQQVKQLKELQRETECLTKKILESHAQEIATESTESATQEIATESTESATQETATESTESATQEIATESTESATQETATESTESVTREETSQELESTTQKNDSTVHEERNVPNYLDFDSKSWKKVDKMPGFSMNIDDNKVFNYQFAGIKYLNNVIEEIKVGANSRNSFMMPNISITDNSTEETSYLLNGEYTTLLNPMVSGFTTLEEASVVPATIVPDPNNPNRSFDYTVSTRRLTDGNTALKVSAIHQVGEGGAGGYPGIFKKLANKIKISTVIYPDSGNKRLIITNRTENISDEDIKGFSTSNYFNSGFKVKKKGSLTEFAAIKMIGGNRGLYLENSRYRVDYNFDVNPETSPTNWAASSGLKSYEKIFEKSSGGFDGLNGEGLESLDPFEEGAQGNTVVSSQAFGGSIYMKQQPKDLKKSDHIDMTYAISVGELDPKPIVTLKKYNLPFTKKDLLVEGTWTSSVSEKVKLFYKIDANKEFKEVKEFSGEIGKDNSFDFILPKEELGKLSIEESHVITIKVKDTNGKESSEIKLTLTPSELQEIETSFHNVGKTGEVTEENKVNSAKPGENIVAVIEAKPLKEVTGRYKFFDVETTLGDGLKIRNKVFKVQQLIDGKEITVGSGSVSTLKPNVVKFKVSTLSPTQKSDASRSIFLKMNIGVEDRGTKDLEKSSEEGKVTTNVINAEIEDGTVLIPASSEGTLTIRENQTSFVSFKGVLTDLNRDLEPNESVAEILDPNTGEKVENPKTTSIELDVSLPDTVTNVPLRLSGEGLTEPIEHAVTEEEKKAKHISIVLNNEKLIAEKTLKAELLGSDGKVLAEAESTNIIDATPPNGNLKEEVYAIVPETFPEASKTVLESSDTNKSEDNIVTVEYTDPVEVQESVKEESVKDDEGLYIKKNLKVTLKDSRGNSVGLSKDNLIVLANKFIFSNLNFDFTSKELIKGGETQTQPIPMEHREMISLNAFKEKIAIKGLKLEYVDVVNQILQDISDGISYKEEDYSNMGYKPCCNTSIPVTATYNDESVEEKLNINITDGNLGLEVIGEEFGFKPTISSLANQTYRPKGKISVGVKDGRYASDGWRLSVTADAFTGKDSKKMPLTKLELVGHVSGQEEGISLQETGIAMERNDVKEEETVISSENSKFSIQLQTQEPSIWALNNDNFNTTLTWQLSPMDESMKEQGFMRPKERK